VNLTPYGDRALRWRKVLKHVFLPGERWWEVFDDLDAWHRGWRVLQGAGCFAAEEGWRATEGSPDAARVLDAYHSRWLAAAGQACDEALAAGRVYPTSRRGRSCYVGEGGVTVYAADGGHLVTCFRPAQTTGSRLSPEASAWLADQRARRRSRFSSRAAVRRAARRASLGAGSAHADSTRENDR